MRDTLAVDKRKFLDGTIKVPMGVNYYEQLIAEFSGNKDPVVSLTWNKEASANKEYDDKLFS
eukprot:9121202-Lingulodinium_polyedra.AAC.1